jgi:acetyltransferase-like isoleucine patch superfamily enzyme
MQEKRTNKANSARKSCLISKTALLSRQIKIGSRCYIGDYVIIGDCIEEKESIANKYQGWKTCPKNKTGEQITIGNSVTIESHARIANGVRIGDLVRIGPFVYIGWKSKIGKLVQLMYSAQIHEQVSVGENSKIGGFLCDHSKIGKNCVVMGNLIHKSPDGWIERPNLKDESPILEDDVFASFGSQIIGKVRIRRKTFIFPGAIVNKDTPGQCILKNIDEVIKLRDLPDCELKYGKFFSEDK